MASGDGAARTEQAPQAPSPPNATSPDHSTTNTHEVGIDEPDIVKTDGKRVVSVANGHLKVVDVASRKVTGTLDLPNVGISNMLLSGDRALVVSNRSFVEDRIPGQMLPEQAEPALILVDLSGAPKTLGTLAIDGSYVDARQVGSVARVVVRSQPRLNFVYPDGTRSYNSSLDQNRNIAAQSTIDNWLPHYQLDVGDTHTEGRLVDCDRVSHARDYSATGMLTVLTIDLTKPMGKGDPVTVAADGDTVYGTDTSLYVADDHRGRIVPMRYKPNIAVPGPGKMAPRCAAGTPCPPDVVPTEPDIPIPPQRTQIHRFDITGSGPPRYAGSGEVDGTLLNQYSLSEYDGNLRVATTVNTFGPQPSQTQNIVTVLARRDNSLPVVGRVDGLGKGERIYAVRFIGAVGYVVTFHQTDPLYTLDLSQAGHPRVVGELKIPGYSTYLHPVGDGKVLGVGVDTPDAFQVSLFDVGNPAAPSRASVYQIKGATSQVGYDPHAFLYWPARNLVVVPVTSYKQDMRGGPLNEAVVLRLDSGGLTEIGRISHPNGMISRSLVIGDELWTLSDSGLMVNGLADLAQRGWVPLR